MSKDKNRAAEAENRQDGKPTAKNEEKDIENKVSLVTFEDGVVTLGDTDIPGILKELRVDGKVRFDKQKVDGASGKKKTPQGFEDQDIMLSMILMTDETGTCYDKLEVVSGLYQKIDDKANPQIYTVTNRHLLARGVRQVVFSKLQSAESDADDEMTISMGFVEHNPPVVKVEKAAAKSPTPKELAEAAAQKAAEPAPDSLIVDVR